MNLFFSFVQCINTVIITSAIIQLWCEDVACECGKDYNVICYPCVSCNCQTVEACVSNLLHSFLAY